jgi:hypothetical protein
LYLGDVPVPRLSNDIYYERHLLLQRMWVEDKRAFSLLTPYEQLELHRFFQTAQLLTQDQLAAYRQALKQDDPSLANRAGKVYALFLRRLRGKASPPPRQAPYVQGVLVRAEPNYRQLARASMEIAQLRIAASREVDSTSSP